MKTGSRISTGYYGGSLSATIHFEAPERVAWICQRAGGSTVLDIGCNRGIISILLARAGKKVTGIDIDGDSIKYAKEELTAESDSTRERLTLIHGDVLQQSFRDHSFDITIIEQLIDDVSEQEAVLDLAGRVCKPAGRVIVTTSFGLGEHLDCERAFYLYHFVVLMSRFYVLKELDIVGRYIAFSGEPHANRGSRISRPPVINQEWHERIHRLYEREYEQLEFKSRVTLLAQSSIIAELQNRIEDLKNDRQVLRGKIEGLIRDRRALHNQINRFRKEYSGKTGTLRTSATFRIGEALVRAVRPSKATITLPLKLWHIYRDYKSKKT